MCCAWNVSWHAHRQAIGAEPRAVVIDYGCAKELYSDCTLTVPVHHVLGFTLEGNQPARAPELYIELEAAKREACLLSTLLWLFVCVWVSLVDSMGND